MECMRLRSVLGAGTAVCLALMLLVTTGCPPAPPPTNACSGDPCDDMDPCTIDTCTVDADAPAACYIPVSSGIASKKVKGGCAVGGGELWLAAVILGIVVGLSRTRRAARLYRRG